MSERVTETDFEAAAKAAMAQFRKQAGIRDAAPPARPVARPAPQPTAAPSLFAPAPLVLQPEPEPVAAPERIPQPCAELPEPTLETRVNRNKQEVDVMFGIMPLRSRTSSSGWLEQAEYEARLELGEYFSDENMRDRIHSSFNMPIDPLITRLGGKKQLAVWLVERFPRGLSAYIEPFMGSGRVFFTRPERTKVEVVNDRDTDLIHFYRYVAEDPQGFADYVNDLPKHEAFLIGLRYELQAGKFSGIHRAAAFYMVTCTAFNGVTRAELGKYATSPLGVHDTQVDLKRCQEVAARLRRVDMRSTSYTRIFAQMVKVVPGGAFYYMDPPYDQTTGYVSLREGTLTFGWAQQVELSEWCCAIHKCGNRFIQTNSDTARLRELYGSYKNPDGSPMFRMESREVRYSVSGQAESMTEYKELIISNYDLHERAASSTKQRGLFGDRK